MTRKLVLSTAVLAAGAIPGLAGASGVGTAHITVKPAMGSPSTRFVVSFRAPQRTGRFGAFQRHYILAASGPASGDRCVSDGPAAVPDSHAHARVRVILDPKRLEGRWCVGAFHGQIEEIQAPACPQDEACPAYVLLLGTIGQFTFHVKPSQTDTTPPTFAGLVSAFACTPGPQRPGQTTPVTLSWKAARDDVTPSSEIVYDVYMSTTQGDEDFSKPTWTTPPGATTFKTPGLPSHGTFYFVVRARDQAGNEDRNRVERRGLDPCL